MFVLQDARENHWAEFKNILIGRSDNAIKNKWNSCLRHTSQLLERTLNEELKIEMQTVGTDDQLSLIMNALNKLIKVVQQQYLDHLKDKATAMR